jgi:hypothetical protein
MVSFSLKELEAKADQRPRGYMKTVLKYGRVIEDRVFMTAADHQRLANHFRQGEPLEPSFFDMAGSLIKSLEGWAKRGFPIAREGLINKRREHCLNCNFWDKDARGGLGKCNHRKCGCTKVKWWIETEKCPIGKW